jgi:hypothetical protein
MAFSIEALQSKAKLSTKSQYPLALWSELRLREEESIFFSVIPNCCKSIAISVFSKIKDLLKINNKQDVLIINVKEANLDTIAVSEEINSEGLYVF